MMLTTWEMLPFMRNWVKEKAILLVIHWFWEEIPTKKPQNIH